MSTQQNAFGNAFLPPITRVGAGIQTDWGVLLPPNTKVAAYVNSGGLADLDDPYFDGKVVTTLNAGLAKARSGKGDIVLTDGLRSPGRLLQVRSCST
jgi:hypothetical protein